MICGTVMGGMIGGTVVDDFFGISFVYFFGISCQFFCVHYLNEWWSWRGQSYCRSFLW